MFLGVSAITDGFTVELENARLSDSERYLWSTKDRKLVFKLRL